MHPLMTAQDNSVSAAGYTAARKSRKSSIWPETDISIRKSFSFAHKGCALLLAFTNVSVNISGRCCLGSRLLVD